jgi:transcriptional regulator with XRE-family HTH domain
MLSSKDVDRRLGAIGGHLGSSIHGERRRRRLSLAELAARAGLSRSHVQWLEAGNVGSIEAYLRVAAALGMRLDLDLVDPRRSASAIRAGDPVHAAMGEWLIGQLAPHGYAIAVDEPYQYYQFAGRADVVAWESAGPALLQVENRTRFPNVQEALGSYNAK